MNISLATEYKIPYSYVHTFTKWSIIIILSYIAKWKAVISARSVYVHYVHSGAGSVIWFHQNFAEMFCDSKMHQIYF